MKQKIVCATIKSLYGETEWARREWERDKKSEGGKAYELFIEMLDIADWMMEGPEDGDDGEDTGEDDSDDLGGGDAPAGQQVLQGLERAAEGLRAPVRSAAGVPGLRPCMVQRTDVLRLGDVGGTMGGRSEGLASALPGVKERKRRAKT